MIALCRCTLKGVNILTPRWLSNEVQQNLCYCGCNILQFDATYIENLQNSAIHDYCSTSIIIIILLEEVELSDRIIACKNILNGTDLEFGKNVSNESLHYYLRNQYKRPGSFTINKILENPK